MKVELLEHTPNPEKLIASAAKLCYSASTVDELMTDLTDEKVEKFLNMLFDLGHESPIEHATFTFAIEGISRACYDKHTQVLTNHGWKYFKDVDIEKDTFCSMNNDGDIEYVKAVHNISYNYDGLMDLYLSTQVNLCVTPNHNMWVYDHEKRSEATRTWKFLRSDELVNCRYGFDKSSNGTKTKDLEKLVIPDVIRKHHKPFKGHTFTRKDVDYFLELLGIWVTDGSLSYGTIKDGKQKTGNRISISQIKPFVRERIEELLDNLGMHYRSTPVAYYISDQALFDWLVKNFINGNDTHKTYYLTLPRWMYTDLSVSNIRSFIKGVYLGNGSHHVFSHKYMIDNKLSIFDTGSGFNIYTGSESFANDLVEISLLAGLCGNKRYVKPRFRIFPNGKGTMCKEQFVVSILNNGYHMFKTAHNKRHIEYHDKVYCVELEKFHKLYVMRDGKACWCGNCSHQLVRHRIASYSQKSQRYVNETQFGYVVPPTINTSGPAMELFNQLMQRIQCDYEDLRELIKDDLVKHGMDEKKAVKVANEDARFVLPNACETSIIVTMNIRSLFNFFKHRCCNRAQWEIREVAMEMWKLCMKVSPTIFSHAGPDCVTKGCCSEGKMTCGSASEKIAEFRIGD